MANVSFTKKVTTKVIGSANEEIITDEIFAGLSKANQLLVVLAETYTDVQCKCVKYTQGYGLASQTITDIAVAMKL